MSKVFFDANILLDILLPARVNHNKAIRAYEIICKNYDILATSEDIITTIEYIALKNKTDCKVVWKFFDSLNKNFEIYNFTDILEDSLNSYKESCQNGKKIDFEDLLQINSAIKNGCNAFITEDKEILKSNFSIEIKCLGDFDE